MNAFFFPRLQRVEALANYRLRTYWNTKEVLDVDMESALRSNPAFHEILQPSVFSLVHVGFRGSTVEWKDSEFGADNVYAWGKEQKGEASHKWFETGCATTTSRRMRLPQPLGYPLALCVATLRHKAPSPAVSGLPALAGRP